MELMLQETKGQSVGYVKSERFFAGLLLALCIIDGLIGAAHHQMWRDELQHWLLAKHATGLVKLYHNPIYDGHPGVWCGLS